MPHPPSPSPRCLIDTRDPVTGSPVVLSAEGPAWSGRFEDTATLIAALPAQLEELARIPDGLLVGLCPYPHPGPGHEPGTPATLMLFRHFQRTVSPAVPTPGPAPFSLSRPFASDWTRAGYTTGVRQIQQYLRSGDAYQVNLAQRFSAPYRGDPAAAYLALREVFQPPHGAYIDLGDRQVLSLSPESFLEVHGNQVVTRPIKGTRPRHPDPAADLALANDLRRHPKDRAENLMIVDLLRNDLGKVCRPGSVRVPALFEIESFRNVHHLVSTVSGELRPGVGFAELLAATFPGGSITGAPKRRAMEIITELEPHPRDAYCGSIFWGTADGTFGSNILIRTFLAHAGMLHGWAGAGIVADSDPESEYQECLHKLRPLMDVLENLHL